MTGSARDPLDDICAACAAIDEHLHAEGVPEQLRHDAIRMRLVEIGVAVDAVPPSLLAREPGIPWNRVAHLGERLTRRPSDVSHALVLETARVDVPRLVAAVRRLLPLPD